MQGRFSFDDLESISHIIWWIRNWDLKVAAELMISAVAWRRTFQGKGVNKITSEDVLNELNS